MKSCLAFQACRIDTSRQHLRQASSRRHASQNSDPIESFDQVRSDKTSSIDDKASKDISRRDMLISLAATAALLPSTVYALSDSDSQSKSLEDLELGEGNWEKLGRSRRSLINSQEIVVPPLFSTYLARILINYDEGVAAWWRTNEETLSLLSEDQRKIKLGRAFGNFAASIQQASNSFVRDHSSLRGGYEKLSELLLEKYGSDIEAKRHIGILFGILPIDQQPVQALKKILKSQPNDKVVETDELPPSALLDDFASLLPANYGCIPDGKGFYTIQPIINVYEIGISGELGQAATATLFGPLSSDELTRQLPNYSFNTYALFGLSGATGCALTHSIVIPLDVVKTKAQTDPEEFSDIFAGVSKIVKEEGVQGLLTGAQATLAGYFWYGLSVYPSYTFFKRYIGQAVLSPDFAALHANDIALVAGALAAVIASLGLTPLEAARIRVVADPERYKSLGLFGTLKVIAEENPGVGWTATYAGLPSLMTRQVIFGSVKFLAFERACESIFAALPFLRDATWTALAVTLVAGAFSGTLSSVVSQPADAVLTYVAQKNDGKGTLGVIEGCQLMVEESGVASLFRGVGSRSVWAGSIIAGQFLLYDIFRNFFGVNPEDLSQVFRIDI